MPDLSLDTEAQYLKGVGPRNAKALAKAGLHTVGDVLMHLPRRYEDRRNTPPISSLRPNQWVTVRGYVKSVGGRPTRRGMVILNVILADETGQVTLVWFNQPWIRKKLADYEGEIIAYGQTKDANYGYEIHNPEWEMIDEEADPEEFARIVPVYPLVDGLPQKTVRKAARSAIRDYLRLIEDPLPDYLLEQQSLRPLAWCLRQIHEPESEEQRLEARKRLVFEDFLYLQLSLAMRRAETHAHIGISFPISELLKGEGRGTRDEESDQASVISDQQGTVKNPSPAQRGRVSETERSEENRGGGGSGEAVQKDSNHQVPVGSLFTSHVTHHTSPLWDQIHKMLPFKLTGAQERVIQEIWADMELPHPMNRLVQGDVGSGKTAVAACAMLAAIRCGYQAALMAPTEILAEQHAMNLRELFEPLGIEIDLLVGKQTATQKKKAIERTQSGQAHIAIGTHALIQEGVEFNNLGLIVIDEQHRFGVLQRAALREKALGNPDVLVMTATPIPRTLTMTIFGDLDLSVIDELPPGRKPIKTHWKQLFERPSVYQAVRKLIEEGRQAYFVCPMVSESEKMLAQAAEELHYQLVNGVFKDLRVGLLHGQMKPKDKEAVMEQFRKAELDILVSTTVIEVGVDVPNASVMVIEDANRFGLSQLHQLRGRVGRGEYQSYCILVADSKTDEARKRMEVMVMTSDGFKIAEEDLKLRGPGEIAGTRQSGNLDFKVADLVQDGKMLEVARQAAIEIIEKDPKLQKSEHRGLLQRVEQKTSNSAVVAVS